MASRSSAHYNSEFYQGSRRGRPISQDMGWEMFPGRTERTHIIEDPNATSIDQRTTLMDYSPDNNAMLASEEPRRNTHAVERLNVREMGMRYRNMPWANEDWDNQFHDPDPRYYLTEQPWQNYRSVVEAHYKDTDFKDDGDYSTTSGHIHQGVLHKKIRAAQDWVRARMKIFETAFENRHTGGVGIYPNISRVFKSTAEDKMSDSGMSLTAEDPEIRKRMTMRLSDIVHEGSAALHANTTTDHKVKVAAYGKLYKNAGLINHEHQLRILEDDTPWSRAEGRMTVPKSLVNLMSSLVNDKTAAAENRMLMQNSGDKNKYHAMEEMIGQGPNSNVVTKDIMALLGFTMNEVKFLESRASENKKPAQHSLAQLYYLAEMVQKMPPHARLELRNELILRSMGGGLTPSAPEELRKNRESAIVNPKVVQYMDMAVRSSAPHSDGQPEAIGDPENRLAIGAKDLTLFVQRAAAHADQLDNTWSAEDDKRPKSSFGDVHNYSSLAKQAERIERNRRQIAAAQEATESAMAEVRQRRMDAAPYDALVSAEVDNEFGENRGLTRHIGRVGTKQMRAHMDSDYKSYDRMADRVSGHRKNPRAAA